MEWSKCRSRRMRLESSRLTLHHVWSSSCLVTALQLDLDRLHGCNRSGWSGEVAGSRSCEHVASREAVYFLTVQWTEITSRAVPWSWGDFSLPSIPINFDTDTYEADIVGMGMATCPESCASGNYEAMDVYHTRDYVLHMIIGCTTCWKQVSISGKKYNLLVVVCLIYCSAQHVCYKASWPAKYQQGFS